MYSAWLLMNSESQNATSHILLVKRVTGFSPDSRGGLLGITSWWDVARSQTHRGTCGKGVTVVIFGIRNFPQRPLIFIKVESELKLDNKIMKYILRLKQWILVNNIVNSDCDTWETQSLRTWMAKCDVRFPLLFFSLNTYLWLLTQKTNYSVLREICAFIDIYTK